MEGILIEIFSLCSRDPVSLSMSAASQELGDCDHGFIITGPSFFVYFDS